MEHRLEISEEGLDICLISEKCSDFYTHNENLFNCTICYSLLNNPRKCEDCQKFFCRKCIMGWIVRNSRCPSCNKAAPKVIELSVGQIRFLSDLKLKCPFGCEVCLLDYPTHIAICSYENSTRPCWNCSSSSNIKIKDWSIKNPSLLQSTKDTIIRNEIEIKTSKTEFLQEEAKNFDLKRKLESLTSQLLVRSTSLNSSVDQNYSFILPSKEEQQKCLELLNIKSNITMLFSSRLHGFSPIEFHKKCDNMGPTIILAKTNTNKVIGGFSNLLWSSPSGNGFYYKDNTSKSFLFSFTLGEVYKPVANHMTSICCVKDKGPIFGKMELVISESPINKSDLGLNYNFPRKNIEDFYGSIPYTITEYEVFLISNSI